MEEIDRCTDRSENTKDVSLKLPVTLLPLSFSKKKKRKKTQHDPGVQPGLQIFKLEEILSQRTNIYGAGIQVGFLHFNASVSKRAGLYMYSVFWTLTKFSVD